MRYLILCALAALAVTACQKQPHAINEDSYLVTVQKHLQDSLFTNDFIQLDFSRAARTHVDSVGLYLVRIPFSGKSIGQEFILAYTSKTGQVLDGRIIQLTGGITKDQNHRPAYNGFIVISSLNRKMKIESRIANGYIEAFVPGRSDLSTTRSHPSDNMLQEVVVVGYTNINNSTTSGAAWFALTSVYNNTNYSNFSNYYSSVEQNQQAGNGSTGGGPNGGSSGGGGGGSSDPILIDIENQDTDAPIDVAKFLKCFDAIPDAGANCSIEIFSDIPVDNDPYRILNLESGSPGHTFLQLKKVNGSQTVQQTIGFYPKSGWKVTLTNAPIEGKFVNNGGHEFNASYRMSVSPAQFKLVLTHILYLQNLRYDIDGYNCTDFTLEVFNLLRSHPLTIPLYDIPGGMNPYGTSTPHGLYHKLKQLKDAGGPEAANITVGIQGWVGGSKGPCN